MFITSSSLTHKISTKIGLHQVIQKIHSRTDPEIYQKICNQIFIFKKIFSPTKSTYFILKFDQKFIQYVYQNRVKTNCSKNHPKFKLKSCKFYNHILDRFWRTTTIHGIEPVSNTTIGFFLGFIHHIQGGITLRKHTYIRSCHGLLSKIKREFK